ncbi:MAG: hypothetical protein V3U50_00995 [Acidimicrobiia bacterium]
MNWILWLGLLAWSGIPITLLVADRVIDADSHRFLRLLGWPIVVGSAVLIVVVGAAEPQYLQLVGWGALVGLMGTITLDVVRLVGLRFGAFPLDMPLVFGAMATGQIRGFQRLVMGRVLRQALESDTIEDFVRARVRRLPRLTKRQRVNVAAMMTGAIATLSDDEARRVGEAQFAALSSLVENDRRKVMATMDAAATAARPGQPRGLPRIPMSRFRSAAASAVEQYRADDAPGFRSSLLAGYLWHAVNGVTFGIMYALIFGQGSWLWALAWGAAVWLAMMIAMPLMMPTLALPKWFPVVPFVAHVAMVGPFVLLTLWVSDGADLGSLVGWLAA